MKKHTTPFVEENKKRAAFKRFSQIGATGLAVMSLSAFTHLSAQQLPDFVENDTLKEKELPPTIQLTDTIEDDFVIRWLDKSYINHHYIDYTEAVSDYCDYTNYSNYSNQNNNYTNNYSNNHNGNYTNNYSNYSEHANYADAAM